MSTQQVFSEEAFLKESSILKVIPQWKQTAQPPGYKWSVGVLWLPHQQMDRDTMLVSLLLHQLW